MKDVLKRESLLYGIGHILTRLVSFLLLPIFTNVLSTSEYGIIALIYAFIGFFTVILHLGLDVSLLRHYKPAKEDQRAQFVTNAYIPMLIINIIFIVMCLFFKNIISMYVLGDHYTHIFIIMMCVLFFDVLWSIPMIILRSDNKPIQFIFYNLINVISNIVFIYFFVIYYNYSLIGVVLSNLLSSFILFIITINIIYEKISLATINLSVFKKMFQFGMPFILAGIFSMIIELSDRYIIKYILGVDMVGIYSAGYKLGMLMLLVVMGFNMAWQPFFLDKDNQQNFSLLSSISNTVFMIFSFIACGIIIFVDPLSQLEIYNYRLIGEEFYNSLSVVPWICLGYLFHGAYLIQLPTPYITNNTSIIAIVRGLGAASNIILNFYLIPLYGITGAALATCLCFILMSVILFIYNKKIDVIQYNLYPVVCSIVIVLNTIIIISFNPSFVLRVVIFFMIPCCLLLLGCFDNDNINHVKTKIYEYLYKS